MDRDSSRNQMITKFYCAKHKGVELTFSSELSNIGANSAYEINPNIYVNPCRKCLEEIEQVSKAVGVLINLHKPNETTK